MYSYYSLIILIFILAGLAAAIWNGRNIIQKNKSKNWPRTDGHIFYKTTTLQGKEKSDIYFNYTVDETKYEQKIEPDAGEETMPGFEAHFKKQYPDGDKITVYYDKNAPENTQFSVGASTEDKLIFGISVGAILLGLYAISV